MSEIKEENVLAKLQYVGYKGCIKDICESALNSLYCDETYRITMIIEKVNGQE